MGKTKWNNGQLNAINTKTRNILVSAGAGSGKTSVLSERVLEKLKDGWQINRFLILTFTNAAAAEMKERIRNKIIETKGLEDQIPKIDTSYICTFDSFALAIIKKYHYALNLPQTINVCDESVMKTTILKHIDVILNEYYQNPTDEFKKFMFGEGDPNDPKKGGLVGAIQRGILDPLKDTIHDLSEHFKGYLQKNILNLLHPHMQELLNYLLLK